MSRIPQFSIAARLPLGIGLLLASALGGMAWTAYREVRRSHLELAADRLTSLSGQFRTLFEVSLQQRSVVLERLAAEQAIADCLEDPCAPNCELARLTLARYADDGNQVLGTELWDAEGMRVLVSGREFASLPGELARAMELAGRSDRQVGVGAFQSDGEDLIYRVVAPARSGVRALGHVSEVRRVSSSPQATAQLSELLGSDARLIVGSRSGPWHDLVQAVPAPPAPALESRGPVEYARAGGAPVLAAISPIVGGAWFLAIEFPLARVLAPARRFRDRALSASLLFTLLGVGAGWWFSRGITRPLARVAREAEAIATGSSRARVGEAGRDELGRLESSFQTMAGEVEGARQRLERQARHYQLLFDENPLPMWVSDPESGRFLEVNRAAIDHYGLSREEFLAARLSDISVPGEETPRVPGGARDMTRVVRHRLRDGRVVEVELTQHVLATPERGLTLTLAHDITQRLATERALREREQDLATTLDSIGDAVISTDVEGRIVRMNPVAEALTGWPAGEARGRPLSEVLRLFDEGTGLPEEDPFESVLREGTLLGQARQTSLRSCGGGEVPIAHSGAPIRDGEGELRGVVLVFRDMSSERAAERSLREKEARKSAVHEAAIDGIVTIDQRGHVVEFNPAAERIFGIAQRDVLGRSLAQLFVPERLRDKHLRGLARCVATGEGPLLGRPLELPALRGDGSEFPAEISIVRSGRDDPPLFTGFIRDLTERRQLEEQLRQSQKLEAIGLLAGGVAHDFNNLLSVILGYCEILASDGRGESGAEIAEISSAALRAADLTRQLLAFSRQQVLQPKVIDLCGILIGMEGLLKRLIGEDIELAIRPSRAPGLIHADPGQMEQVVMNLAINARDAMPDGGRLTLEVGHADLDSDYAASHAGVIPGPFVMLAVTDSGMGMDEATRSRIFEPFFTTKPKGRGTGLGLSTVFGIVKQSGGHIWVYSERCEGTTFKVYLPRADAADPAATPAAAPEGRERGAETILLVEDDGQLRGLSLRILEMQGYRVLQAADGEEALRVSAQHPARIDLLLTDVVMPRTNGRQLADLLRKSRPETKVLFMSGYTDDAIVQHGVLGPDIAFIQKPLTSRALAAKVRAVLDG